VQLAGCVQSGRGSEGAPADKKRCPLIKRAGKQLPASLAIETACHCGLRFGAGGVGVCDFLNNIPGHLVSYESALTF
jgi:hypothetical protein